MAAIAQSAQPNIATRLLASVTAPDTPLISRFTHAVCRIVETRATTTYDNFARDFGERFVPGYKPVSTVDYLLNSPFRE